MRRYLADRRLITEDRLVEVRYEDLCSDPLTVVERIYSRLGIDGLEKALPAMQSDLESHSGDRPHAHELTDNERTMVRQRWQFAYEEWGYATTSSRAETLMTSAVRT
jgi:hypothetical protein